MAKSRSPWLDGVRRLLRLTVPGVAAASAAFLLLAGLASLAPAFGLIDLPGVESNPVLTFGADTLTDPYVMILASFAAIAGSLAILAVVWLYWTMSNTARLYQERLGHPDEALGLGEPDRLSVYRLLAGLHDKIVDLEKELQVLRRQQSGAGVTPSAEARHRDYHLADPFNGTLLLDDVVDPQPPSGRSEVRAPEAAGPRTLPAGYYDPKHRDPARPAGAGRPRAAYEDIQTPAPDIFAEPRQSSPAPAFLDAWEREGRCADFMQTYRDGIVNPSQLAPLEASGRITSMEWHVGDELTVGDGANAFYWFVDIGDGYGLALPSRSAILQWPTSFQAAGGSRARGVFSMAYEISSGPVLQVSQPAWVQRHGAGFRIVRKGALSGA